MKRFLYFISTVVMVTLILTACNGGTEVPTVVNLPGAAGVPDNATQEPAATDAPATLAPIDLAGPAMELGSKYQYVDGSVLVAVPGGPFVMGYNAADNPVREVTLSEFWIYSTKITNQQYALCVQTGKCTPPDPTNNDLFGNYRYINFPVTGVNYEQAAQYCSFVHGRLPTEAEWEKTARGPEGNIFPWGDAAPACDLLNYKFCVGKITAINEYKNGISFFGAFDMAGNTREWVFDWYSPTYYNETPVEDPLGPELGDKRSVRGSSFQDSADPSISAHRFALKPDQTMPDLGFRCVVEDPTYFAPLCQQLAYAGVGPLGGEANCTPEIKCNDVSISQASNCTPNLAPYTIVTFEMANDPPTAWTYDSSTCTPLGSDKFQCDPPGPLEVSAIGKCEDVKSCVSGCPANYNKVDNVCQWDGSGSIGIDCIAGTTYDPLTQCCSATPGSGVDFNLCPAGFYPLNGACVPNSNALEDKEFQPVLFNSCEPRKKPDNSCDPQTDPACQPQGCTVDPLSCAPKGLTFDAGLCCCGVKPARGGPFVCR